MNFMKNFMRKLISKISFNKVKSIKKYKIIVKIRKSLNYVSRWQCI